MRTIDEVIKALECCCEIGLCKTECPYQDDCMDDKEKRDALYYLKKYRDSQKMTRTERLIDVLREVRGER